MSEYRLLIDWEVLESFGKMSIGDRRAIRAALLQIAASPDRASHFQEAGAHGICLEVHVFAQFALKYWIDFPDRHIKVLELVKSDR